MLQFSANISMLFNEVNFLDRFEKAAKAGFHGVEFLFPYAFEKEALADQLKKYNMIQVLHNLPAGNWEAGERGIACIPGRENEFQAGVEKAIEYAKALECKQLNCLVGITPKGYTSDMIRKTLINNLGFAVKALNNEGIRLLVEPLNSQDVPGFYLVHSADAKALIKEINHPNIFIQYDVYHMQIMEGNLIKTIVSNLDIISHIQIADNPGRNEPGTGEINYCNVFAAIDNAGFKGWIGCEYKPAGNTENGLSWFKNYQKS